MKQRGVAMGWMSRAGRLAAVWPLVLVMVAGPCFGARFFVDAGAQGDESGVSWENAFTDLQPALTTASSGDEIWVACSTYLPSELLDPEDPRSATFAVTSGVSIFGGFSGGEGSLSQRDSDPQTNGCVFGESPGVRGTPDGVYHIVRIDNVADPILIDGFSIVGGRADGDTPETQRGGGMRINGSTVTLRNMNFNDVFTRTDGPGFGGAVFSENSVVLMEDIRMSECRAGRGGGVAVFGGELVARRLTVTDCLGGFGGGPALFHRFSATVEVADSLFENNVGNNQGGAVLSEGTSALTIRRSIFRGNRVGKKGGAIQHQQDSSLIIENSVFVGNVVLEGAEGNGGGAVSIEGTVEAVITNSTIAHNEAGTAGSGVQARGSATALVQNSVIHGNILRAQTGSATHQVEVEPGGSATATVEFSIIEGGFTGEGNLDVDPVFKEDPTSGDGSWGTVEDNDFGDVRLQSISPAIDAGNNLADIDGDGDGSVTAADLAFDADRRPRLLDLGSVPDTGVGGPPVIDLGAFEFFTDRIFGSRFEAP